MKIKKTIFLDLVEVRLSHHFHQSIGWVDTSRVDLLTLDLADLAAHDGGQVELDGGLGNVEVSVAEEADDDGLVLGEAAGVAGGEGADQLLGAVVGVVLAGDQEHLVDVGDGSTVTSASVSVRTASVVPRRRSDESTGDSSDDEGSDDGCLDGDDSGEDEGRLGVHDDRGEDEKEDGQLHRLHFDDGMETTSLRCEYFELVEVLRTTGIHISD